METPEQPNVLDAENYIPGLITWLANKLSAGASQLYHKHFDLGVIDWRVLATIGSEGGATGSRICQVVGLDKAAVSRSFAVLERRDLIVVPAVGGRARVAHLTEAGRVVHDKILAMALAREAILLEVLSAAEAAQLRDMLHRLLRQVAAVNASEVG